jgi:hypothetical protein
MPCPRKARLLFSRRVGWRAKAPSRQRPTVIALNYEDDDTVASSFDSADSGDAGE